MTFAVVIWTGTGATPLPIEEIEVLNIQKLVIHGSAAPGSETVFDAISTKNVAREEKLKDAKDASFLLEDAYGDESDGEETEDKTRSNKKERAGDKNVSKKKEKAKKALSEAQRQSCSQLVATITAPLMVTNDSADSIVSSSSGESDTEVNTPQPLPQLPSQLVRRQVGMKTPKSSFPPTKCINVHCKEEKRELKRQVESLKQEIEDLKSSSSKEPQSHNPVLTPSGGMDANEASKKGLAEIVQGVWCCAVKVKALINSVPSRTALACAKCNYQSLL